MKSVKNAIRNQIFQNLWASYCQIAPRLGTPDPHYTDSLGKLGWRNTLPGMDKIGDWILAIDPYHTKNRE